MSTQHARLGLFQVSFAGVLWGTGGFGMELVADHSSLTSLTVSAWRMGIAAVVLTALVAVRGAALEVRSLLARHPVRAALAGVCTGGYQALYFASVLDAGVTVSTVISLGVAPVLLTIGEAVRARRRPSRMKTAVLATALVGLVLVSAAGGGESGGHPVRGVIEAVASGSLWALTTAISRGAATNTQPLALNAVATTAGTLLLIPMAAIGGGPFVTSDPTTIATLLYLGIFTMALAYGLLYAGLRTVPGSAAVIAALLEPVTATVVAALFLDERIGIPGLAGTLLILGAVLALNRSGTTSSP
ncbi:DMT family transporter [Solwaraspora sp. WMMB335]|uniref:DMT family transporter n=1 Tax=Solwaraspora sp. WMMB335 TaxID=3404118 RepID=UPI003B94BEEE